LWPNSKYYRGIHLARLRNSTKNLLKDSGSLGQRFEIETSANCNPLDDNMQSWPTCQYNYLQSHQKKKKAELLGNTTTNRKS